MIDLLEDMMANLRLRRCERVGHRPVVRGRVWIRGPGRVRIGDRVVLDGSTAPIELHTLEPGATIVLGDGCQIAGGSSIEAVSSVVVGSCVRLGRFCKIMDSNFHPLVGNRHERPAPAPVVIEDDAELATRVVVLPGSRVGSRAFVASGSVVTRRLVVPSGAVVRGFPAVLE